ncbi:MAG: DUF3237 family protein [Gammaproteobacteria bacterium]|jgi:hypothetical protein|nr:DUF3237 family protein [Gammaproteobacteria bacterium]|tara:strand:+ start:1040 stop:1342 length:303 start_codon:yes stop_codon:yes gene_type:complete
MTFGVTEFAPDDDFDECLARVDDGMIYVTNNGRLVVPKDLIPTFTNPDLVEGIDPANYHFRINPVFEVSDPNYHWLNNVVCIGLGQRTKVGVRYQIFVVD